MKPIFRKRVATGLGAMLMVALLAGCAAEEPGEDDVITLRFAHYMPSHHTNVTDGAEIWMEEVEDRTDGQVSFEHYPGGQLVSAQQMVPSLRAGVVDVGIFTPASAAPSELPLSEIPAVPGFEFSNLRVIASAYQELLEGPLTEEWEEAGIQPMMSLVSGGYQVIMQGGPRESLADWTGRSVRSAGGVGDFIIDALGASSVNVPGPEQYEALDRGTVDSGVNSLESVPSYDFDEVTDAGTTNMPLGAVPMAMGVSRNTYEELPENVKNAMQEASEITFTKNQDALQDDLDEAIEQTSETLELYELTEEGLAELEPALEEAQERWAAQREGGADLLNDWGEALARAEERHGE